MCIRDRLKIVREGKEKSQGVGYLEDGTMVVVDDARSLIGSRHPVVVTGALQTPTGRMVFARLDDGKQTKAGKNGRGNQSKGSKSNKTDERTPSDPR